MSFLKSMAIASLLITSIWANSLTMSQESAVRSAERYLDMADFSCRGLIKQLSSNAGDKYTVRQATYAARKIGLCR